MCQAIRDGGQRCAVHQHGSIAVINSVLLNPNINLNSAQVKNLFTELRREGRGVNLVHEPEFDITSVISNIHGVREINPNVQNQMTLAQTHNETPAPDTQYALTRLLERAQQQSHTLSARFNRIAGAHNTRPSQVEEAYRTIRETVDVSRGSVAPPEYTPRTRRLAREAGLPYDRASVVALEKVTNANIPQETQPIEWDMISESNNIRYNSENQILQVDSGPENTPKTYTHVSPETAERFFSRPRIGILFPDRGERRARPCPSHRVEQVTNLVKCLDCGQFKSQVNAHSCPILERATFNPYISAPELEDTNEEAEPSGETVETPEEAAARQARFERTQTTVEELARISRDAQPTIVVRPNPGTFTLSNSEIETPNSNDITKTFKLSFDNTPDAITPETALFPHTEEQAPPLSPTQPTPTNINQSTLVSPSFDTQIFTKEAKDIIICNQTNYERRTNNKNVPEEHIQKIRESNKRVMWVLSKENEESEWELKNYDSNFFTAATSRHTNNNRQLIVSTRGKRIKVGTLNEEAVANANDTMEALKNSTESVTIEAIDPQPSDIILDGRNRPRPALNNPNNFAITGNKTQIKEALENNKTVILQANNSLSETPEKYVDDQGYNVRIPAGNQITGEYAIRLNNEGGIEVVSHERSLKCNCSVYQANYYCRHVNYYHRHIGSAMQRAMPIREINSSIPLPTHIASRNDIELVNENKIRFVTPSENLSEVTISPTQADSSISSNIQQFDTTTPISEEFVKNTIKQHKLLQGLATGTVKTPENRIELLETLKEYDVQMPIQITNWDRGNNEANLEGTLTYKKNGGDYNSLEVDTSDLRCDCEEYRTNNYHCVHTRTIKDNALFFIYPESVLPENTSLYLGERTRNSLEYITETYAQQLINDQNIEGVTAPTLARFIRQNPEQDLSSVVGILEEYGPVGRIETAAAQMERIERANQQISRSTRTPGEVSNVNRQAVENYNTYRENMRERWSTVEENTPENFYNIANEARTNRNIDFRTENVTDGICAEGEGTRSFGIEIEFDISRDVDRYEALRQIGEELHDAGLTTSRHQQGYHEGSSNGWGSWSFEEDCTVAGEIVSPIMKDTPEHWEQLRQVCEIVNRNGGKASARAGSHVHVSTGSFQSSTAKHYELVRQARVNRETLYRLATNPGRGTHRGTRWCSPNTADQNGDIPNASNETTRDYYGLGGHGSAINTEACNSSEYERAHAEFRMWDGSIDPAVIQQQVMVSAAMVDLAERNVEQNGISRAIPVELNDVGHVAATSYSSQEEFYSEGMVNHAYNFINKLFRKQEDRNTVTQLFGRTNWMQGRNRNNDY